MTKIINYFQLNQKYQFDITDITSLIFVICAIVGIMGGNPTILFTIGSLIATIFCWKSRRINLIVLNVSLLILNLFNLIKMF